MAHTTSALNAKLTLEAANNEGIPWSSLEAAVELLLAGLGGTAVPPGTFNSVIVNLGSSQSTSIPVSVLSWSVTCLAGAVIVAGKTIPVGLTARSGGYPGRGNGGPIAVVSGAGASAFVIWDTV